ncbi:hypothetical protein G9A89_003324 [Geosiphon pyriformis]|nr:hypothetical protein G9A89_003324 [Geosiphon pyriformis]
MFSALNDWEAGTPYQAPVPQALFPVLALLLLISGFVASSTFSVTKADGFAIKELASAIPASLALGFGTLFLFLSVGIYV